MLPLLAATFNGCLGPLFCFRTCLPPAPPNRNAQQVAKSARVPVPTFATTTVPSSTSARRRWILVIFGSEQASRLLFGSERRVNHLVRSNTSRRKGRGWSRINCHGPLPVRAEASVPRWKTGPRLPDWQPLRGDLKTTNTNARPYEIRWLLNQPPRPWQFKWLSHLFEEVRRSSHMRGRSSNVFEHAFSNMFE